MAVCETHYIVHDESGAFAHRVRRNPDAPDFGIQIDYTDIGENGEVDWETTPVVVSPDAARKIAAALIAAADDIEKNKWD